MNAQEQWVTGEELGSVPGCLIEQQQQQWAQQEAGLVPTDRHCLLACLRRLSVVGPALRDARPRTRGGLDCLVFVGLVMVL